MLGHTHRVVGKLPTLDAPADLCCLRARYVLHGSRLYEIVHTDRVAG